VHQEIFKLLLPLLPQLDVWCQAKARTRPGLERKELFQAVVHRFVEKAPEWFQQEADSREGQALSLLYFQLLSIVKEWDRQTKRERLVGGAVEDGNSWLEQLPASLVPAEREIDAQRRVARLEALQNPVYLLLLLAVSAPERLSLEHLESSSRWRRGGSQVPARAVAEAWEMLRAAREAIPSDEATWKRTLAEILHCTAPLGESTAPELRGAKEWLDKSLQRARRQAWVLLSQRDGGDL
jgi:hypothetical protein